MNNTDTPMFEHDSGCDECHFLGHVLEHDLYHCKIGTHKHGTIMLRYGNGGHEYHSGFHFSTDEYFNAFINNDNMKGMAVQLLLGREALLRAITQECVPKEAAK